jgi:hypothetical protein
MSPCIQSVQSDTEHPLYELLGDQNAADRYFPNIQTSTFREHICLSIELSGFRLDLIRLSSRVFQFCSLRNWQKFQRCWSPWWWRQYAPLKCRSASTIRSNISEDIHTIVFAATTSSSSCTEWLLLWRRSSSKCYSRNQSVPQREHHTSPL